MKPAKNMAEIDARLQLRRANVLEERVHDLERALEFVLRAPYEGLIGWANTLACVRLGHPPIRGDKTRTCYCKFAGPGGWGET